MHACIRMTRHALLQEGPLVAPGTACQCHLCARKDWLCQLVSIACDASTTCFNDDQQIKTNPTLSCCMFQTATGHHAIPLTPQ
eukprot:1159497-Pelagomonas_calceolata.AAC.6